MTKNSNGIQKPHLFAIVSWGCAATTWIAKALNSHQDILCVHASNHPWYKIGGASELDGVKYMNIIEWMGHFYTAVGDIHGVSRYEIKNLKSYYGDRFSFCIVVREPISRLKSHIKISRKGAYDLSHIDEIIARFNLPRRNYTEYEKFFIHACNALNRIIDESKIGKIFRCEDLTSSPQAMLELVEHISNGKVSADSEWAEKIVKMPPIASKRKNTEIIFDDWHFDILSRVVKKEAWEAYSKLGYKIPDFIIKNIFCKIDISKTEQLREIQQNEHSYSIKATEETFLSSDTTKVKRSHFSFEKIKQGIRKIPFLGFLSWWLYMIIKTPSKINELSSKLDNLKSKIESLESKIYERSDRKN